MQNKKKLKTFEEMGVIFSEGSGCNTCRDNSCSNTVLSLINEREFNVHISTNQDRTQFRIHASENSNTISESDIEANFTNESDAVIFVCKNFEWFKCF